MFWCNIELTDENTYPSHRKAGKKICKRCSREYHKKWKEKNLKWTKEYSKNYYLNHKNYELKRSKSSRRNLKKRMILTIGGKCSKCGYNKCIGALETHHLDKTTKDKANITNKQDAEKIIKLWKEEKIQLLCANCHRELHYEI